MCFVSSVLVSGSLLLGVYVRAPDFWKLQYTVLLSWEYIPDICYDTMVDILPGQIGACSSEVTLNSSCLWEFTKLDHNSGFGIITIRSGSQAGNTGCQHGDL